VAAAVLSDFDANAWWIIVVLAVALLTVLMSLLSRAEKPWPRPPDLSKRLSDAKDAVDAMHRADPRAGPEEMHRLAFDAWWALTHSAEGRERLKRRINLWAVLGLVTEVVLAAVAMFVTAR
jgi:type VI protein secretion system component VasF